MNWGRIGLWSIYKREVSKLSKSILVISTPENCTGCSLYHYPSCHCYITGKFQNNISEDYKPDWCPLKEVPDKKKPRKIHDNNLGHFYISAFDKGYNKCIDDILQ